MPKKILLTIAACLAITLTITTAAYALGPIRTMVLVGSGSPTTATMSGSGSGPVTFSVSGGLSGSCSGGTFVGTANPGSLTNYATINTVSPGTCGTWRYVISCNITLDANTGQNVNATAIDTNVTGRAYPSGGNCLRFENASGCTLTLGGNVNTSFDEVPDGSGKQGLTLNGSGLFVASTSFLCLGMYSIGSAATISAPFRVETTATTNYLLNFID